MSADIATYRYPDVPAYYESRAEVAGDIMLSGLCWLTFFYLVIKPYKLLNCENPEALEKYENTEMLPRWILFFNSWREYENIQ